MTELRDKLLENEIFNFKTEYNMKTRISIYRKHFAFACVLLVTVIFCGCGYNNPEQQTQKLNKVQKIEYGIIQVVVIDSCEYVVWNDFNSGGIVHKQNCKFCAERIKK